MQNRPAWIRRLLRAALCILTLGALAFELDRSVRDQAPVLAGGALWALAAGAVWILYGAFLRLNRPLAPLRLWLLSALFAAVTVLGHSFAVAGTAELAASRWPVALLGMLGRAPLYFAGMRLLLEALQAPAARRSERFALPGPPALWTGLALLMCWLPWYICLFPGTVSNDSLTQLKELLGVAAPSNGNPVFQTWLVGVFVRLGRWFGGADAGVALYCIVQAALMAWLMGALVNAMRTSPIPRWLVWLTFAFYAFCPVFPVFAFCVGKDTNFAMAVLFLSLAVKRVTDAPADARHGVGRAACLCLAAVLCTLLRNPGVYLALLTLGLLLAWTLRRNRQRLGLWRAPVCAAACVLAVYGVLHLAVLPALRIAPMPESENYSLPLQQVARVAAGGALTPEQEQGVRGVLPVDRLKGVYNGELSDPVKALWREDATDAQKRAFWRTWPLIVLDHPMTCLSATFHNTYGYLYPGYISTLKPTLLVGDQSTRTANVKGLYDYSVNPLSARIKALTDRLAQNPLYRLLVSPGLYGWLTLLAGTWLLRGGERRRLLCVVPALFTLAGCLLSAVNGYFRYAMPLYVCAPLLLWVMTGKPSRK